MPEGMCHIDERVKIHRQKILRLRRQFARLEEQRSQSPPEKQANFSQKIVDICLELDRVEEALWRINRNSAEEVNQLRSEIVTNLEQFNQWREKMREMEKLFFINFVRPGYILKQAVRQREYLEDAYQRLRKAIISQKYDSLQELTTEIQRVLHHADNAYEPDQRSYEDEKIKENNLWEIAKNLEPTQIVEEYNEDQILRDFKKIVLPAVHPDTSDTPVDTFLTVKEVYEEGDYLLMEAYVARYRGEIEINDQEDPLEVQEQLSEYVHRYHRLSERLNRKLNALKKELTPEELEDPEKVKKLLNDQQDEIRKLIQIETEKIFELRNKVEGLIQFFLDTMGKR